jgi:hypothetical protein
MNSSFARGYGGKNGITQQITVKDKAVETTKKS